MTKRDTALALARVAGYHNDSAAFTRLIIESRVGRPHMNDAWHSGALARKHGMRCNCSACRERDLKDAAALASFTLEEAHASR